MKYIYNVHAHVFNLNHVSKYLAKGYIWLYWLVPITWLKKSKNFRKLIRTLRRLRPGKDHDIFDRLANLAEHGHSAKGERSQLEIFQQLQTYYPSGTRFVLLSMDMEYMNAGPVIQPFEKQLEELAALKKGYKDLVYPFLFIDPRRLKDRPDFWKNTAKRYLDKACFNGIKMYPALGYWPFDKELMTVYDYALEHKVPILSHCERGIVHDRGRKRYHTHPMAPEIELTGKKSKKFTAHFTHPINFHCLLNPELISEHWGVQRDYSKLKICLAHFGGAGEWLTYLQNPFIASSYGDGDVPHSFKRDQWNFKHNVEKGDYTWFSVIKHMCQFYPNVYTDISYMLNEQRTWPLIKLLLSAGEGETPEKSGGPPYKIRDKILFGTDFYVVAKAGSEREISIGLRSYLGEDLFYKIAHENVERFLFD